jgi:hypothetical protein
MNVSLASTYTELEDIDDLAFDMSTKSHLSEENKRTTAKADVFPDALA